MNIAQFSGCVLVLVTSIGSALTVSGQGTSDASDGRPKTPEQSKRAEAHGKRYPGRPLAPGSWRDLMPEIYIGPVETPLQFVTTHTCGSRLVTIGTVMSLESMLTPNDAFIFSDYQVRIDELLAMPPGLSLQGGDAIVVTRSGGEVTLHGERTSVRHRGVEPLVVGATYLLFLTEAGGTNAYEAEKPGSAFAIQGASLRVLSNQPPPFDPSLLDINAFRADVGIASQRCNSF
jgi:hypothetical protein